MIREVDLATYLPEFMRNYKEPVAALDTENPEFAFAWDAVNKVLYNRFIDTADEYGISRFEKVMGLYPESTDTLEMRRTRIMARWFTATPYTIRMLAARVSAVLTDGQECSIALIEDAYELILTVSSTEDIPMGELKYILSGMMPMNMLYKLVWLIRYMMEAREQFRVNLRLNYKLPYWQSRFLDGTWLMDGTNLLDATRGQVRMSIVQGSWKVINEYVSDISAVNVRVQVPMEEKTSLKSVLHYSVDNTDNADSAANPALSLYMNEVSVNERFLNVMVTTRRNLWRLDGTVLLDGSNVLNALDKKEDI